MFNINSMRPEFLNIKKMQPRQPGTLTPNK
jgi:hypothetical protein